MNRCRYAINFGLTLTTRCMLAEGHDDIHVGKGLEQFSYQTIEWSPGDRREFQTDRGDEHAWER